MLTDTGRTVLDFARRFRNLEEELDGALAELRDKSAGRLVIGANESSTLYLLPYIERYRGQFPKIKVQVRRAQSSRIPVELLEGDLELGVASYDPGDDRLVAKVIYTDALAFIVSPKHRLARRRCVSITELGEETFIAHNVLSPYRELVLREFRRHKVPLRMDVEMPTLETIRRLVQNDEGVAFLPRMCVRQDVESGVRARGDRQGAARRAQGPPPLRQGPNAEPRGAGVPGARSELDVTLRAQPGLKPASPDGDASQVNQSRLNPSVQSSTHWTTWAWQLRGTPSALMLRDGRYPAGSASTLVSRV